MGTLPATAVSVDGNNLPIPKAGLHEVLRRWSGRGRLLDALAAVDEGRDWSWRRDYVERRAYRVLFQQLTPRLAPWPKRIDDWQNALPAESLRDQFISPIPRRGASWRESRRYGWPPRQFVGRSRTRTALLDLAAGLRWTLEELLNVWRQARRCDNEIDLEVRRQMIVAELIVAHPILQTLEPREPTAETRRAMRSEGRPWTGVADVADTLIQLDDSSLYELAEQLIMPDEDLRWRLFHLGVLGDVVLAIEKHDGRVTSMRPLGGGIGTGPAYLVELFGQTWEFWFEGAGLWAAYGSVSPYLKAMEGLGKRLRVRSPDLVLMNSGRALVLECKYSDNSEYLSAAYEQVTAYANELRTCVADNVHALVVAPEGVVSHSSAATHVGEIGMIPADQLSAAVAALDMAK